MISILFESDFRYFCGIFYLVFRKKSIVEEIESIMGAGHAEQVYPCEFVIHRNHSLSLLISLEYKLTWVNSVPHSHGTHDGFFYDHKKAHPEDRNWMNM